MDFGYLLARNCKVSRFTAKNQLDLRARHDQCTNVEIYDAAIGNSLAPKIGFYLHDRDMATASLEPWAHAHKTETVKRSLTTIDRLTRDWDRFDLVKIDAEGAELSVWQGMQETLKRFPE